MYNICGDGEGKKADLLCSTEFPLKDSAFSKDQFVYIYDFIIAIHKGNYKLAKERFVDMKSFLNDMCCKIATELILISENKGCV